MRVRVIGKEIVLTQDYRQYVGYNTQPQYLLDCGQKRGSEIKI